MSKKIFISIVTLFLLSTSVFVAIGLLLPNTYNATYRANIQISPKVAIEQLGNVKNWDSWFIFNSKNSNIEILPNGINIITSKNKSLHISNVYVNEAKVFFILKADKHIVDGYFDIQKESSYVSVLGFLSGEVSTPVIGGLMSFFIQSSLENILKTSLLNLKANYSK